MTDFVYWLLREYGELGISSIVKDSRINPVSGMEELDVEEKEIERVVLLPITFSSAYAANMRNSDFNYGNWFAQGGSIILIDAHVCEDLDKLIGSDLTVAGHTFRVEDAQDIRDEGIYELKVKNLAFRKE